MDACQFFLLRHQPVHSNVTKSLLTEITDEQIRCRPVQGINTIAWIVWHMARAEDIALSRFVAHRPQLFFEEAWAERLNVPFPDFGVGMTADEVADLSARIDLKALRAYWAAVEHCTESIVEELHPRDLDEDNSPAYIRQVVDDDGIFREAGMWGEGYWTELPNRSKGFFLGYLGHTHNWLHFGEAMATRSLLGRPGG